MAPNPNSIPPPATNDPSGYFPYLWCGAGTSTYVFIDPLGNYGYNKGAPYPLFYVGLDAAYNYSQHAMEIRARDGKNPPTGDGPINAGGEVSTLTIQQPVGNIAGTSGISAIEVFVQNANHQKVTWGIMSAAMTILKDFVLTYPLYADAMYFQIGDDHWSTVGNGYMGILLGNSTSCQLKGTAAQNNVVPCAMPSNYPDS